MKKLMMLSFLVLLFTNFGMAQNKSFVGFSQLVDVQQYEGDSFKLEGAVKMITEMEVADIAIFARVYKKDDSIGFAKKTAVKNRSVADWEKHTITGILDENADALLIGGYCAYNGQFYYDDFKLSVQKDGQWLVVPLKNASFENTNFEKVTLGEKTYDKKMIQGWGGFIVRENRATFTPISTKDEVYAGNNALLIEGKGYFYAPTILKKYVGEWDIEFIPDLSENAWPGAIMKGVIKNELVGNGYVLQGPLYGKRVFDGQEDIFWGYSYMSYHPDLGKIYETEIADDAPPGISVGVLKENGNIAFKPITIPNEDTENRTYRYTWLNDNEFSIIHEFDGARGDRAKLYYRVTRRK